ncbi:PA14 domain-containing protein [Haloferula sp.]|uniref:PA14 domain-containing protein n=1 Tax=Haloferula sp. TaxID=2497595 RepID=UPI003C77D246
MRTLLRVFQHLFFVVLASSAAAQTSGRLTLERWTSAAPSATIEQFGSGNINVRSPDAVDPVYRAAIPRNYADGYGARLRGALVAPVTGRYVFYVSGDDLADLWLSTSDAPFDKRRIAWHGRFTANKQWDKYPTQRSESIWLEAGEAYYIEGLMFESSGADHLFIGWNYIETATELTAAAVGSVASEAWTDDGEVVTLDVEAGDIWSTSDNFSFYNYLMVGDGEVTVHVKSLTAGHPFAQVGLMMRPDLGAASSHAFVARTAGQGTAFKRRGSTGATTIRPKPYVPDRDWLRITRNGDTVKGYHSQDGKTWRELGSQSFANLPASIYVGIAASSHPQSGGQPIQATLDSFQIRGSNASEVIPGTHLQSFVIHPDDLDDDQLPDSWELAQGFSVSSSFGSDGQYGDPDGDGQTNFTEFAGGSDPNDPNSTSPPEGLLWVEQWEGMPHFDLESARASSKFYLPPNRSELVDGIEPQLLPQFSTTRMRGYLEVPDDGDYTFWISNRYSGEIWLSDDETKYRKQRISCLSTAEGTGGGVRAFDENYWDQYLSQMSREIPLLAGRKYFFEVLVQQGHAADPGRFHHISLAWAGPDGVRRWLPLSALSGYLPELADADDDYLPDAWENQYGLNAADNGYGNLALEGERGDFDEDGLNNREEFLLGTNPADSDTDGDGLSDFAEVRTYGTSPSVSDVTPETLVSNVSPSSVLGLGDSWIQTGGGVLTSSFRGIGKWNFTVPGDGIWIVQIEGGLRGDLRLDETLAVHASVDGGEIERGTMTFHNSQSGSLRVITPWLPAGSHEFGLYVDNYTARRSLEVTAIRILAPGGLDTDGDGYSDPVEQYLTSRNQVLPHTAVSTPISPVFVEGLARSRDHFELRIQHEGPGSAIRHKDSFWAKEIPRIQSSRNSLMNALLINPGGDHSAAGSLHPGLDGPGYGRWFAEIPLNANQATGYSAFFENGALGNSGVFVWRPINLFATTQITIPAGRDLLMGAWDGESDNSDLTFTIDGQPQPTFKAKDAIAWSFPSPGSFPVSVLHHQSGLTLDLTVNVRAADLQPDIALGELRFRDVDLPGVASDLALDTGGEIAFDGLHILATGGTTTTMGGLFPGIHRTAARLTETEAILDQEVVHVVGVSDALRNASDLAAPQGDDIFLVRSPLLVTHLPADGATVKISIFAGGVTFADGTTVKEMDNADLDENGVITLEFLMPAERLGAPCHYIDVFDKNGARIWSSNG